MVCESDLMVTVRQLQFAGQDAGLGHRKRQARPASSDGHAQASPSSVERLGLKIRLARARLQQFAQFLQHEIAREVTVVVVGLEVIGIQDDQRLRRAVAPRVIQIFFRAPVEGTAPESAGNVRSCCAGSTTPRTSISMRSARPAWKMVATIGGEELAILLRNADAQGTQEFAERLRLAVVGHSWPQRGVTGQHGDDCAGSGPDRGRGQGALRGQTPGAQLHSARELRASGGRCGATKNLARHAGGSA